MGLVHTFKVEGQHEVELFQSTPNLFAVRYGQQVRNGLNYADAAKEVGENLLHALSCAGKLKERPAKPERPKTVLKRECESF